jgi:hypothetical protein
MRNLLLAACNFSWDAISPSIFGSLFQSVMLPAERRRQGAHYTTEGNILKVIQPLFLDDLRAEFEKLQQRRDAGRRKALEAFHRKLARLRFFDPACGCGDFLIITYRELRQLEIDLLKTLRRDGQLTLDVSQMSQIDVDQFYGIELNEFGTRIAEVALWMMDHLMNNALSLEFGESYARIPIKKSPHILNADALEVNWADWIVPAECSYILGNPPFGGSKYQTPEQRAQVRRIAQLGGSGGTLDYVTAWFIKAGECLRLSPAEMGFVATNSITQGEQVAQLWPILFERLGLEISFAHRTFAWQSDTRGMAHVHVVIVGLCRREQAPATKRLFSYDDLRADPVESRHSALTAYLFDASKLANRHLVVQERSQPLCDVPKLISGSQPIDDGNYIFKEDERAQFLAVEPGAERFLRPYVGGEEYIKGQKRWILALQSAPPHELRGMPHIIERMRKVRAYRLLSQRKSTLAIAETPARYNVEVIPDRPFLAIPEVSSEKRAYVPIGWLEPPIIPSNKLRFILGADLWHFGILTSAMHMAWLRQIGGRLESRFQYSIGVVYNTFPWPNATDAQREQIRSLAQAILNARAQFLNSTLADLYDVDVMPRELRKAHRDLDTAVDKLYRSSAFTGDLDRVEQLFGLYEQMITPLSVTQPTLRRRRSRTPEVRSGGRGDREKEDSINDGGALAV